MKSAQYTLLFLSLLVLALAPKAVSAASISVTFSTGDITTGNPFGGLSYPLSSNTWAIPTLNQFCPINGLPGFYMYCFPVVQWVTVPFGDPVSITQNGQTLCSGTGSCCYGSPTCNKNEYFFSPSGWKNVVTVTDLNTGLSKTIVYYNQQSPSTLVPNNCGYDVCGAGVAGYNCYLPAGYTPCAINPSTCGGYACSSPYPPGDQLIEFGYMPGQPDLGGAGGTVTYPSGTATLTAEAVDDATVGYSDQVELLITPPGSSQQVVAGPSSNPISYTFMASTWGSQYGTGTYRVVAYDISNGAQNVQYLYLKSPPTMTITPSNVVPYGQSATINLQAPSGSPNDYLSITIYNSVGQVVQTCSSPPYGSLSCVFTDGPTGQPPGTYSVVGDDLSSSLTVGNTIVAQGPMPSLDINPNPVQYGNPSQITANAYTPVGSSTPLPDLMELEIKPPGGSYQVVNTAVSSVSNTFPDTELPGTYSVEALDTVYGTTNVISLQVLGNPSLDTPSLTVSPSTIYSGQTATLVATSNPNADPIQIWVTEPGQAPYICSGCSASSGTVSYVTPTSWGPGSYTINAFDPNVGFSNVQTLTVLVPPPTGPTAQQECSLGGVDQNNWVQLNLLVVLMALTIAGLVYSLSNFLPAHTRERVKGAVKTEGAQAILSMIIIFLLLGFATFSCGLVTGLSNSLLGGIVNGGLPPFQFSNYYVSNLLFTQGTGLEQELYAQTVTMMISASIINALAGQFVTGSATLASFGQTSLNTPFISVGLKESNNLDQIFYAYSEIFSTIYASLVVVTFGLLLILFLLLPVIQATALTIVVPVALILRVLPFMGPRLRMASDSILALAIAFYFVLPLVLALNAYVVNWMFTPCPTGGTNCNVYQSYLGTDQLTSIPLYPLFQSNTVSASQLCGTGTLCTFGNLQVNFFNPFSIGTYGSVLTNLASVPQQYVRLGDGVSEYLFEGIVLLAIDTAIVMGFAQGLAKGLGAISNIVGAGPVWSV